MENDSDQLARWIEQLTLLAAKHPLKDHDLANAKNLMRKIKACGYTNREINKLTSNSWSESTIKLYTRNVGEVKSQLKAEHFALLEQMIKENIGVGDLKEGLSIISQLKKTDFKLDDMLVLVNYLKDRKTLVPYLLNSIVKLRADGISAENLVKLDEFRKSLATHGIDIGVINRLAELLNNYQDKASFLKSIIMYDTLASLSSDIDKAELEREKISRDLVSIREEISSLIKQRETLSTQVSLAQEIGSLGLTAMMLKDLRKLAENYGSDPSEIVKAIDQYSNVAQLESKVSFLEKQKAQLDHTIIKQQRELARLIGLTKISGVFLSKFKFSMIDINFIYEIATRYGDTTSFFKALAAMAGLQEIEKKSNDLQTEMVSLEGKVSQLEKSKSDLEVSMQSIRETATLATKQMLTDLGNIFKMTTERVTSELNMVLDELSRSYKDHAEISAQVQSNEERLRICSVLSAVMYNDVEAIKSIPPGYLSIFIQGALNICQVRYINPYANVKPRIAGKYDIGITDIELVDLLELARSAVQTAKV